MASLLTVVHPWKSPNHCRATYMTSFSTSFSTAGHAFATCWGDVTARLNRLPFVRGVELNGQHIQSVPGGDADSPEQAEQSNHGWLAVAKGQEEAADARDHTGARWRCKKKKKMRGRKRSAYKERRKMWLFFFQWKYLNTGKKILGSVIFQDQDQWRTLEKMFSLFTILTISSATYRLPLRILCSSFFFYHCNCIISAFFKWADRDSLSEPSITGFWLWHECVWRCLYKEDLTSPAREHLTFIALNARSQSRSPQSPVVCKCRRRHFQLVSNIKYSTYLQT